MKKATLMCILSRLQCVLVLTAHTEANFRTFFTKYGMTNMLMVQCLIFKTSQTALKSTGSSGDSYFVIVIHIQPFRSQDSLEHLKQDQQMNSSRFMPSLILPLQIAIKDISRFKLQRQAKVQGGSHTSPINDQLPLFIGQLEKLSGRSIARVSGEKGKKLGVVWWRCKVVSHCVKNLKLLGVQIFIK